MPKCIFCEIIEGEHQRSVVFEDAEFIAFVPIEPMRQGHVLLMPKAHYEDIFCAPPKVAAGLLVIARDIAAGLKRLYNPPKVGLIAAGITVAHAHFHIAPLYTPFDVTCREELEGKSRPVPRAELDATALLIRGAMGAA